MAALDWESLLTAAEAASAELAAYCGDDVHQTGRLLRSRGAALEELARAGQPPEGLISRLRALHASGVQARDNLRVLRAIHAAALLEGARSSQLAERMRAGVAEAGHRVNTLG